MKTLLWLDDIRDPKLGDWLLSYAPQFAYEGQVIWVKNHEDFVKWIRENGLPDQISFDHDLGIPAQLKFREKGASKRESRRLAKEEKSGMDCAKWLVDYCLDNDIDLPKWGVHSANPTGAENIRSLLKNFQNFRKKSS